MMSSKRIYFRNEDLHLLCEWDDCCEMFSDFDDFLTHISKHADQSTPGEPSCLWQECEYDSNPSESYTGSYFLRHVLFHGFHSKIKCLGANILKRNPKIGECLLHTSSRNIVPDLPHSFQCGWKGCQDTFDNPEYFYKHVNYHVLAFKEKRRIKPLRCHWQECNAKLFPELEKLRSHLRSHSQEKLVSCPTCGNLFSNRTKFLDHIRRQLPSQKAEFQCVCCQKYYPTKKILKDHMRSHVYRFKCIHCDFMSVNTSNMNNHMKYKHSDQRLYPCSECKFRSKTVGDLKTHQEIHNIGRHYECEEDGCDAKFKAYVSLLNHYKKIHLGKSTHGYACHMCDQIYSRGNYLTKHLFKSHDYKFPKGQTRSRFKESADGYYRLLTIEYKAAEKMEHDKATSSGTETDIAEATTSQQDGDAITKYPAQCASTGNESNAQVNSILVEIMQPDGTSVLCECPVIYESPHESGQESVTIASMET